jgi:hypothetical protein
VTSTTQAKYQTLSGSVKEALWRHSILEELLFKQDRPTTIDQENKSMVALTNYLTNYACTKYIDVVHHFIRENMKEKIVGTVPQTTWK